MLFNSINSNEIQVSFCLLKTCYLCTLSHVKRSPLHDGYIINRAFHSKKKNKDNWFIALWFVVHGRLVNSGREILYLGLVISSIYVMPKIHDINNNSN